ncbi:MAG: LPS assembly lipoprotein LptE [Prevotellaceae bacterium]|nr:LPS assembly lipoprotein LptE [Prevotellaceae bacterium]
MKKNKIKIYILLCLCVCTITVSCGIYSFTGASYGMAKTVSIDYFQNIAPIVVPTLSNTFTEALKDKFIKQTPLTLITKDADLSFEGEIRGYSVTSIAVTADEIASKNRLTVSVHVKFVNKLDDKWSFDKDFSSYEDFDSALSINSVQDELIKTIVDKLIEDIFNASVANW